MAATDRQVEWSGQQTEDPLSELPTKIAFVEWLAVPRDQRRPLTQRELAGLLGISQSTVVRWKTELALRVKVLEGIRPKLLFHYPSVLHALIEKAKKGQVPALSLCLEIAWGTNKRTQVASVRRSTSRLQHRSWWSRIRQLPVDSLADAIDEIVEKAEEGNVTAARLFLYLAHDWVPKDGALP